MSEAITKACDKCGGRGELSVFGAGATWEKSCGYCSGSGRVPDVEATLRAEVASLQDLLRRAVDIHQGYEAEVAELRAEVERMSSRLKYAEEVVTQARQLVAYSWEDRLDDSRVSDDAKQDARELEIAVWHYDRHIKTEGAVT